MAAREQEREPLVGQRVQLVGVLGERFEACEQRRLVGEDVLTPDPVDRPIAGGGDDPGAGVVGHPARAATAREPS